MMLKIRLKGFKLGLMISLVVSLIIIGIASFKVLALTNNDVNAIASATTILISRVTDPEELAEALQSGGQLRGAGSGVIVAKQANPDSQEGYDYYVATNLHVAEFRTLYSLRTADGKFHKINNCKPLPPVNGVPRPDQFAANVIRLGQRNEKDKSIQGFDLALVKFTSRENYPIAATVPPQVKDFLKPGETVIVSGWPTPPDSSPNLQRSRRSAPEIVEKITPPKTDGTGGGYSIVYNALPDQPKVAVGMSGGPVFNLKGEVVGIHGESFPSINPETFESTGGGSAINIQDLRQPLTQALAFTNPPISDRVIEMGQKNLRQADRLPDEEYIDLHTTYTNDQFYAALKSLKDHYACVDAYPNGTIRPRVPLIRSETLVDLNTCFNKADGLLVKSLGDKVTEQEVKTLEATLTRLSQKLDSLENIRL
jgi:hypothetical protein